MSPRLSVIIRSYNRLPSLAELLAALLAQDHDSFEIVVIDQSTVRKPDDVARIDALARDPRVRILRFDPLGGPRARNMGARAARGEILVFIDDDDLPIGTDWLRCHERNYADPNCLGLTGRSIIDGQVGEPYANMDKARRRVLSMNLLKFQRLYVMTDRRAKVQTLHGGNVSVRRSLLERFGLWDECTPFEDELSLAYRIRLAGDEYLAFDPECRMLRRLDAPGGMAKRALGASAYAKKLFAFVHNIIAHYFPLRLALLYPFYYCYVAYMVGDYMVTMSRGSRLRRVASLLGFYVAMPAYWTAWLAGWWLRRLRDGQLPHRPTLDSELPPHSSKLELARTA